ncbi:fimbria/pilus outer membrane usher protein [Sphingopyxis solisilvae]|uniref:fimbria/pilus outer membrane usher protein n=1 Tax=Sphingopyxis solisilvae TaxID=1886788 RepID=UPI001892B8F1|nr:fimbria/pilus outer membrane usher protein [Sphingopyxis solisilvae]
MRQASASPLPLRAATAAAALAAALLSPPADAAAAAASPGFGELPPPPSLPVAPRGGPGDRDTGSETAAGAESDANIAAEAQHLFLELIVNARRTGVIAGVRLAAGRTELDRADLQKAGLLLDGRTETIAIEDLADVSAAYDAPRQQLRIEAAPRYFPGQRLGRKERRRFEPARYDMGALLNYDSYVSGGAGQKTTATLFHEVRLFSGAGAFSTTAMLRSGGGTRYTRYDSSWRRSDETTAVTIEAGDLITRSLPWASAVRLGGLQVSRDFAVRPDIITYPLPEFAGNAALPSTVDLVVGGQRIGGGTVAPGPFLIDSLVPISGAGEAKLLVTDLHGRTIETSAPFYVSSALLRPGLTDFAVAAGAFRESYGRRSFAYGGVAATASLRHGVSSAVTLEVRAEIADDMQLAGGGAIARLGNGGVVSGSYSRSFRRSGDGSKTGDGAQWTLGYEYQARLFSLALRRSRQSAAYRDLGLIDLPARGGARTVSAATLSVSMGTAGTLGFGYFAVEEEGQAAVRLANASFALPLVGGSRLHASASRDFEEKRWSGALSFSLPLGARRGMLAAGWIDDGRGGQSWRGDYSRAVPSAGGLGWSASAIGDGDALALRGDIAWRGDPVLLRAGAYGADSAVYWAGASGSLIFMDNSLFAANRVADAFVIVSTDGTPEIPVRYENQLAGRTNRVGKLLIPWAAAYYPALYAIDPLDLPADVAVPKVSERVAVARGGGHVVRFPVTRLHPAKAVLRDASGEFVAAGSAVTAGSGNAVVAWDGLVYLDDLPPGAAPEWELADGRRCAPVGDAHPPGVAAAGAVRDLGEYRCR